MSVEWPGCGTATRSDANLNISKKDYAIANYRRANKTSAEEENKKTAGNSPTP